MKLTNEKTLPHVLRELAATNSTTEKKKILNDSKTDLYAKVFSYAYDTFITYGINKLDVSDVTHHDVLPPDWFQRYFELLDALASRTLTGNNAREHVISLMSAAPAEYGDILLNTIKKDLRIGCGTRVINSVYPGLLPEATCMAAMKYDSARVKFPVYVDTKLDGVRCIATFSGVVKLFSRNAKEFLNYDIIAKELAQLNLLPEAKLDGEITCGNFQNLMRTVSRKDDGLELAKDAVYNVFDIVEKDMLFINRLETLKLLNEQIQEKGLTHVRVIPGEYITTEEELTEYYQAQLASGEEGAMIKTLDGVYEFKRSYAWQKMKPELSDDLIIIGTEEGEGKYKGMLGKVICRLENGGEVRVGSGFVDTERQTLWAQREELVGRMIEVKYQEKTQDGSLRFPVFVRFRADKE